MKRKRFSHEQIVGILQEAAGASTVREVCRRHGITETTFSRWRATYGGMPKAEAGSRSIPLSIHFAATRASSGW